MSTRVNGDSRRRARWFRVGGPEAHPLKGLLVFAISLTFNWRYQNVLEPSAKGQMNRDKTQEKLEGSEAQILFQQAFILLMPPEDGTRLVLSQQAFQRVIGIDPNFAGGYAGKSMALSFQVLFIKSAHPVDDLSQAATLDERAVEVDPEYSLGYAALALAQSLNADTDSALSNVRRVLAMQPHKPIANTIASVALIISGMPSQAIDLLTEALKLNPNESRTPFLNILGLAQYVKGDFLGAAESIERNLERLGPTGPHMDILLASTYVQLGKDFEARAIIEKLQRKNPAYPAERWLANFIKSESELQAIMSKLHLLGLSRS